MGAVISVTEREMAEASALRSRIEEIQKLCTDDESEPSETQDLLEECALHVQSRVKQALSEFSDFAFLGEQDFDACLEHLKEELNKVGAESTDIAKEIELLSETHKDGESYHFALLSGPMLREILRY